MSTGKLLLVSGTLGLLLGVVGALERWTNADDRTAIVIGTAILVPLFVVLPDELKHRRARRRG